MYAYIPLPCKFSYRRYDGSFFHYYIEAVSEDLNHLTVRREDELEPFMSDYHIGSLLSSLENGCLINGMTLEELLDAYYGAPDEYIDMNIDTLL